MRDVRQTRVSRSKSSTQTCGNAFRAQNNKICIYTYTCSSLCENVNKSGHNNATWKPKKKRSNLRTSRNAFECAENANAISNSRDPYIMKTRINVTGKQIKHNHIHIYIYKSLPYGNTNVSKCIYTWAFCKMPHTHRIMSPRSLTYYIYYIHQLLNFRDLACLKYATGFMVTRDHAHKHTHYTHKHIDIPSLPEPFSYSRWFSFLCRV